ncbi:MAG: hypothetical protein J5885_02510 [Clostridia bacterium]|nr:hypothetical protein [Clostridia bacterium]
MTKKANDYFGLDWIISLILAIIPFTSWICGIVTRFMEGKILAGVLRIIPFFGFVIWVVDLVCMITKKSIWRLL